MKEPKIKSDKHLGRDIPLTTFLNTIIPEHSMEKK